MNASYEVREGYLYIKVTGEFNLATTQQLTLQWLKEARRHALNRILCDITLLAGFDTTKTSLAVRFGIDKFVAQLLPADFWLAIWETPQQLQKDKFSENVMVNRGAEVKVTSDLNEALEWLGVTSAGKDA